MNNIPYSIVKANKVEEYVEAIKKLEELKSLRDNKARFCRDIMSQIENEVLVRSGRNYGMRDAATGMSWSDILSLHELTKELVEAKGQYTEIELQQKEAKDIAIKIYEYAEAQYGNNKNA